MTINFLVPEKTKDFTDLIAWRVGHSFVLAVYKLTSHFPSEERFGLISQMRRAAVSVTSNLAEGFGRKSIGEKKQFYSISNGSLAELQSQLLIARDLGFLSKDHWLEIQDLANRTYRLTNALIASLPGNTRSS